MDKLTKERRSWNMSRIKYKDTKPEILLRNMLYKKGFRYRVNYKIKGKPDLVFPRMKKVIFIHGCFWHQHGCKNTYRPKSNIEFWNDKLDKNIKRDKETLAFLEKSGWKTMIVWECEIKNKFNKTLESVERFIIKHAK